MVESLMIESGYIWKTLSATTAYISNGILLAIEK